MAEQSGREALRGALKALRAQARGLTDQKIVDKANQLLEKQAQHTYQQRAAAARTKGGCSPSATAAVLVSSAGAFNQWVNAARRPPNVEQLLAVVRVMYGYRDSRDRALSPQELEYWRDLYRAAGNTPAAPRASSTPIQEKATPNRPPLSAGLLPASAGAARTRSIGRIPTLPEHFVVRPQFGVLVERIAGARVTAVVTGMRGVGKTQLAAACARRAMSNSEYSWVGWINAENPGSLFDGLAAVAEHLGVVDPKGDPRRSAERLRDLLSWNDAVAGLLVFDNATDPDLLAAFLPVETNVRTLITSTDHDFDSVAYGSVLDLEVYERAQSIAFLHEATNHPDQPLDDHTAGLIAHDVGDLPLALTQAAATITGRPGLDYTSYRALLAAPLPRAFTRRKGDAHLWRVDEAILLSIHTAEIATEDPDLDATVTDLLGVVAMLSAAGVEHTLLPDYDGRRDEAIARCVRGSLLTWSDDHTVVIMHRLIARVLRDRTTPDSPERQRLVDNALSAIEPHLFDYSQAFQRRAEGARLVDHIDGLTNTGFAENSASAETFIDWRVWAGSHMASASDLTRAISHLEVTTALARHHLGTDSLNTLTAQESLAHAYLSAERLAEATELINQSLADRVRIQGMNHPDTLTARANLAFTYRELGRLVEATEQFEQVLADRVPILGDDHPDTLITQFNLADTYRAAGRLSEATQLYEKALVAQVQILGADHPNTLIAQHNLAGIYQDVGHLSEATQLFEKVLVDRVRILGGDHPSTLTAQHNLAGIYRDVGRLSEATQLFEKVLVDRVRILGGDHPDTLIAQHNLAGIYRDVGRLSEATQLFEKVLVDRVRI
ncbi:tetratricopeptide repeat protein, partial [Nocardia brasiliensis]